MKSKTFGLCSIREGHLFIDKNLFSFLFTGSPRKEGRRCPRTKTLDHEGNRSNIGSARKRGLPPTVESTAAVQMVRGQWPWVTCLDQFGTRLAYHGVPESHMKTLVCRYK